MIQHTQNIKKSSNRFFRFLLFSLALLLVFISFPRKGKYKYEFTLGATWKHADFYSPANFTIQKLEEEIEKERDSIHRNVKPYFRYDEGIEVNQLALFEFYTDSICESFFSKHKINSTYKDKFQQFVRVTLDHVYTSGIIDNKDYFFEKKTNDSLIFIIRRNKTANEVDISETFTLKSAYQFVIKELNDYWKKHISTFYKGTDTVENIIDQLNILQFLKPNLIYDKNITEQLVKERIDNISKTFGMVQEGQVIVLEGEVINKRIFRILNTLKNDYETTLGDSNKYYLVYFGHFMLILIVVISLYLFLYHFRSDILNNSKKLSLILLLVVIMITIASINVKYKFVNFYLIPFVIIPIILRTIFDSRLAHMVNTLALFILGFIVPNGFEFIFLQFVVSTISIFSLRTLYKRWQIFATAGIVFISYSFIYIGVILVQEADFAKISPRIIVWFAANALLVLTAYPLIYIFEKIFGFLTELRLLELSDLNHPVLRLLADKAPGTFQHSLQVANLAEETIYKIGGNPLLARTGALYHDIGKEQIPMFFIENIRNGSNPHQKFSFAESASIIISHVSKGIELATKYNLPEQIKDFIRTHHGTTKVQYFYRSYMREHPEETGNEDLFTYPGKKPYSKETAVVMIADCVEAASRSLKEISEQIIDDLVENLIAFQISEHQFDDVNLTFKDLTMIKQIFKEKLKSIYHARIEYPK